MSEVVRDFSDYSLPLPACLLGRVVAVEELLPVLRLARHLVHEAGQELGHAPGLAWKPG